MAFAKKFEVEVQVPEGLQAGDVFKVVVEAPELPKQARGVLHGIALEDMTDDQLKRELVNSKSVLYKAKQRNAAEDVITNAEARVAAAEAEKAKRNETKVPTGTATEEVEDDSVDTETADEI